LLDLGPQLFGLADWLAEAPLSEALETLAEAAFERLRRAADLIADHARTVVAAAI